MALDLDARQRAMLAEMGVQVWWPAAEDRAAPVTEATPAPPAAARMVPPVVSPGPTAVPVRAVAPPAPRSALAVDAGPVATMDWVALQAAVAGCQACGLCHSRKNTVFGVGPVADTADAPPRVDWLVVGEAPGEQEDLAGEPFVGQAGKLLDNMLKAAGLSRRGSDGLQGAFIANTLKCRPPGNRNPTPEEMAQCQPFLARQIELLRPRIILASGKFAVQALLQETLPDVASTPLGKLRGRVHRHRGIPVVVTYHPAYLLRALPEKAKAWADLCLALEVLNGA